MIIPKELFDALNTLQKNCDKNIICDDCIFCNGEFENSCYIQRKIPAQYKLTIKTIESYEIE